MPARLRTIAAVTGGLLAVAAPAFATTPTPDCHGYILTDPTNDQYILTPTTGVLVRPTTAIDVEGVFRVGSAETVNIQVQNLPAAPLNVDYTFRWDAGSTQGYWELEASFRPSGTFYTFTHALTDSGSPFVLQGTTGAFYPGTDGVIAIDLPAGESFPATIHSFSARAEQQESNQTSTAIRVDTAPGSGSYTHTC